MKISKIMYHLVTSAALVTPIPKVGSTAVAVQSGLGRASAMRVNDGLAGVVVLSILTTTIYMRWLM
jgi:hypothetical protein